MNENSNSVLNLVKNLKIIHLAMFFGLAVFTCIAYFARNKIGSALTTEQLEILTYISLIFMLIEIPLAYYLFNMKVKRIADNPDLKFKLDSYRASFIIKMALFEGLGILACTILLLGGKDVLLLQIAIVLIFIMLNNPSVAGLTNDLKLSPGDSNE